MKNEKHLFTKSGSVVTIIESSTIFIGKLKIPGYSVERVDTKKRMLVPRDALVPFSKLELVLDAEDAQKMRTLYGG